MALGKLDSQGMLDTTFAGRGYITHNGTEITGTDLGYDVIPDPAGGVLVAAVTGATTFAPGDVLYSINGEPIKHLTDLKLKVAGLRRGNKAVLQVERKSGLRFIALEIR